MIYDIKGSPLNYKLLNKLHDKTFLSCICSDETRQSIYKKVFHSSDLLQLVAVTGHVAFFSKSKYSVDSSDMVIDLEGMKVSTQTFPQLNIIKYLPENCTMLEKVLIDIPKLKPSKTPISAYLNKNEAGEYLFSLTKDSTTILGVDTSFLSNLVGLKIDISILKSGPELRPLYFHFREGETYVVMPRKL